MSNAVIWVPAEDEEGSSRAGRETRASPRVSHPSRFPDRTYLQIPSFAATMPETGFDDKTLWIKRFGC